MKLDKKDWKILALLSKDCRISLTKLAKRVGISREVADYRIKKIVKNGIIKSFCTEISLEALGCTKHVVYLELRNIDKQKEDEIFKFLKNHKFISWIVTSTGKWSIIFDIHSKNTIHLSQLLTELKQELGNHLGEYEVVTLENYEYFHSKFFGEIEQIKKNKSKPMQLDDIDLSILKILRNNASIDYVKLSDNIKLTPEAISKRIKRLKENSIIKQFYIFANLILLGFEHYNIQINLDNMDKEKENRLLNYLIHHPHVSFYYKPIGHWDIEFGVFVRNPGELREFMQELRNIFSENIRIHDTILFYEEIKGNYMPAGVFEE